MRFKLCTARMIPHPFNISFPPSSSDNGVFRYPLKIFGSKSNLSSIDPSARCIPNNIPPFGHPTSFQPSGNLQCATNHVTALLKFNQALA